MSNSKSIIRAPEHANMCCLWLCQPNAKASLIIVIENIVVWCLCYFLDFGDIRLPSNLILLPTTLKNFIINPFYIYSVHSSVSQISHLWSYVPKYLLSFFIYSLLHSNRKFIKIWSTCAFPLWEDWGSMDMWLFFSSVVTSC